MRAPLFQVDAFTSKLFSGNPAAVCPLPHWLDDSLLQAIAAENNLSETAFLVPRERDFEIRWFTPKVEVDLCGHATLAAGHVLFRHLEIGRTEVVFHSRSGPLPVKLDAGQLSLSFPLRPAQPIALTGRPELLQAMRVAPRELLEAPRDYLLVYETEEQVRSLSPDFVALERVDKSGIIVTAPGTDVDFVSRFFAPKDGLPEDPVTGSAHCTLMPYWSQRLGETTLRARQISARGGEISCTQQDETVLLAGQAVTFLVGELSLPEA